MSSLFKFNDWEFLVEMARRERKCPILDFRPLTQTSNFKDILYLGGKEVTPIQAMKQGNLRFDHPEFKKTIRLNLNGAIWEDPKREEGTNRNPETISLDQEAGMMQFAARENRDGKAVQIFPTAYNTPKYFQQCLTIEDFDLRLEYIIKRILELKGFFTKDDVKSDESPNEIILKKIADDIENLTELQNLNAVPPSIGNNLVKFIADSITAGKVLDYMKLIETLKQETPDIEKSLVAAGADLGRAKKLSKGRKLLKRKNEE